MVISATTALKKRKTCSTPCYGAFTQKHHLLWLSIFRMQRIHLTYCQASWRSILRGHRVKQYGHSNSSPSNKCFGGGGIGNKSPLPSSGICKTVELDIIEASSSSVLWTHREELLSMVLNMWSERQAPSIWFIFWLSQECSQPLYIYWTFLVCSRASTVYRLIEYHNYVMSKQQNDPGCRVDYTGAT